MLRLVEHNQDLDGLTEGGVEIGALSDDQLRAMWGLTLEEAQRQEWQEIDAARTNAPASARPMAAARLIYVAVSASSRKLIEDGEDEGLLKTPRMLPPRPTTWTSEGRR